MSEPQQARDLALFLAAGGLLLIGAGILALSHAVREVNETLKRIMEDES